MHLYGFIIGICLIIGIDFFNQNNKLIPKSKLSQFIIGNLIVMLIGARLYHVIDYRNYYINNPIQILQTWNGGLGIFGGLIGSLLFTYLFCLQNKIKLLNVLDTITPILPLCQSIGRLANLFNHENPYWWTEALPNFILYFIINKYPRNPNAKYLIGYGVIRIVSEIFRTDTWVIGTYKIGQIMALIFIIIGVNLIYRERIKISKNHR